MQLTAIDRLTVFNDGDGRMHSIRYSLGCHALANEQVFSA